MDSFPPIVSPRRLGIHYYPDTTHYRVIDLETWLPEFERMGLGWLTLIAPSERSIPEYFIQGLVRAGIQPIPHFQLPTHGRFSTEAMRLLLRSYARWGVSAIALFDRPNLRASWNPADWAHIDLVERFLDLFIPIAEAAVEEGLTPIFPPLEPGGDYWDLSFLQSALQGLVRRNNSRLLSALALGAYAWIGRQPLGWGAGGPSRWPESRPYVTPPGSEDQRGFRIFDWYLAITEREVGKRLPIYLLRAGAVPEDYKVLHENEPDWNAHAEMNLAAARSMAPGIASGGALATPAEVEACNFWLLSATERNEFTHHAWFKPDGERMPVVNGFYRLAVRQELLKPVMLETPERRSTQEVSQIIGKLTYGSNADSSQLSDIQSDTPEGQLNQPVNLADVKTSAGGSSISHYVLLPLYSWGAADWDLSVIQPLLQESHPTVGFSLSEARLAAKVTVVGGQGAISEEALDMLRANGCLVERVLDDGTLVAS